jgi:hypothetical protein
MKPDPSNPTSVTNPGDSIQINGDAAGANATPSAPSAEPQRRSEPASLKPVERLFPFVLRAGIVITGRDHLRRQRRRLQFLLISTDISENSRREILNDFPELPVLRRFSSAEIEQHFHFKNTKAIGFKKSALALSIWREFKAAVPAEDIRPADIPNTKAKAPALPPKQSQSSDFIREDAPSSPGGKRLPQRLTQSHDPASRQAPKPPRRPYRGEANKDLPHSPTGKRREKPAL